MPQIFDVTANENACYKRNELEFSNFPTFTPEKYLFVTYRRKIINIYCPLVTEKSTNPRFKLTCQCLGKPRHGLS